MTLKERLDAVWNMNEIAYPMHICQWGEHPEKREIRGKISRGNSRFAEHLLWCWRGRKWALKLISRKSAIYRHQRLG